MTARLWKMEPDHFEDISCVTESSNAILQGVVFVTPMKKGSRKGTMYFDGTVSDDKGSLRVYGHDANARDKLSAVITAAESCGKGVILQHCEVRLKRFRKQGNGLEVIINTYLCIYPLVFSHYS